MVESSQKGHSPQSALQQAEALCARREKCIADMRLKLQQWKVEPLEISKIIDKLVKDKYIDESRYATFFVRDKSRFNKWGRVKITQALRLKGIPEEIIQNSLQELQPQNDEQTLLELLRRKSKTVKSKSPFDHKTKLIRFGISRGFEYETVLRIVERIL